MQSTDTADRVRQAIQNVSNALTTLFGDPPDESSGEQADRQEHPPVNMGNPRLPPGVTNRDIARSAGATPTGHVPAGEKRDQRREQHAQDTQE